MGFASFPGRAARKALTAASALALAGAGLAFGATPAQAAIVCNQGHVCLYADLNGAGTKFQSGAPLTAGCHSLLFESINNHATSAGNASPYNVVFFSELNCTGSSFSLAPGLGVADLRLFSMNDNISSWGPR